MLSQQEIDKVVDRTLDEIDIENYRRVRARLDSARWWRGFNVGFFAGALFMICTNIIIDYWILP